MIIREDWHQSGDNVAGQRRGCFSRNSRVASWLDASMRGLGRGVYSPYLDYNFRVQLG